MAEKIPSPRHILQRNLQSLIRTTGITAPEIARRAKPPVDRKTVNNYVNSRADPRPDLVEAIARGFGLTAAVLLSENFQPEMAKDGNLRKLLEFYANATENGRESILRVAEMAAHHRP
jgi:hypothetical protein